MTACGCTLPIMYGNQVCDNCHAKKISQAQKFNMPDITPSGVPFIPYFSVIEAFPVTGDNLEEHF